MDWAKGVLKKRGTVSHGQKVTISRSMFDAAAIWKITDSEPYWLGEWSPVVPTAFQQKIYNACNAGVHNITRH